jgi:hypothetical protein
MLSFSRSSVLNPSTTLMPLMLFLTLSMLSVDPLPLLTILVLTLMLKVSSKTLVLLTTVSLLEF